MPHAVDDDEALVAARGGDALAVGQHEGAEPGAFGEGIADADAPAGA